jgi:hypothetical protein
MSGKGLFSRSNSIMCLQVARRRGFYCSFNARSDLCITLENLTQLRNRYKDLQQYHLQPANDKMQKNFIILIVARSSIITLHSFFSSIHSQPHTHTLHQLTRVIIASTYSYVRLSFFAQILSIMKS